MRYFCKCLPIQLGLFFYVCEKKSEISIIKVVFTISLFKKSPFPQYCLSHVMAVHNVIKVETKQT